MPRSLKPAFVAESSLGKLAKWLRLAGLDTRFDPLPPDFQRLHQWAKAEGRIVLTRTERVFRRLPEHQGLLIRSDTPVAQVQQVLRHFGLRRLDLEPLSRCIRCNQLLQSIEKGRLPGDIPEYIRFTHDQFRTCVRCRRIYWSGTHSARALAQLDSWFK
jgi:uncharacterized protein with PIN domain